MLWKDPKGPRRTQKDLEGASMAQQAKTDLTSSFRSLKLFKLVKFYLVWHYIYDLMWNMTSFLLFQMFMGPSYPAAVKKVKSYWFMRFINPSDSSSSLEIKRVHINQNIQIQANLNCLAWLIHLASSKAPGRYPLNLLTMTSSSILSMLTSLVIRALLKALDLKKFLPTKNPVRQLQL